jgi:glycosyltransferase involved in cell wall biosynthesis
MKRALIATLFNEADNVSRWWEQLRQQTVLPDEMVIVDGGSTDGTWEKLQQHAAQSPVPVKLEQRRCNIAEGRNRAIALTDAEIIATTDAGSFADRNWFQEITKTLMENPDVDIVGGKNEPMVDNDFQKFITELETPEPEPKEGQLNGSARNTAFRRAAWAAVGGYPEWLTLTGEDALYNLELFKIGRRFSYNPRAIIRWEMRKSAKAYLKMLYSYGYGAAEAQLNPSYFLRRMIIALIPPLLLLSKHRFRFLGFRYRKNLASVLGWLAGWRKGHRPPADWKKIDGVLLSPEAQNSLKQSPP